MLSKDLELKDRSPISEVSNSITSTASVP